MSLIHWFQILLLFLIITAQKIKLNKEQREVLKKLWYTNLSGILGKDFSEPSEQIHWLGMHAGNPMTNSTSSKELNASSSDSSLFWSSF